MDTIFTNPVQFRQTWFIGRLPYSTPAIGHDEREIAVTLPRNVGHALAKSPVTMARNTQYIFCGRVKHRHLVNISKPWDAVRKAAKTPDVRIHDIRRTVGSWLAQQGESIPTIKALLNHSDMRTTLRYTRSARTQERQALETTSRKLRPMIGSLAVPANSQAATQGKRRIRLRKPETASA
jgi:integrase